MKMLITYAIVQVFWIMMHVVPPVASRFVPSEKPPNGLVTSDAKKEKPVSKNCWETENVTVISECVPCSESDKKQLSLCKDTGNKILIQCGKSNKKSYISCPFAISFEKKRFWTFEAISLAGAVLSNVVVWWRRRVLNNFHYQRVKRQMSSATV